jgi:redox-sensitive bicupin YhaK (pirin superfamily)
VTVEIRRGTHRFVDREPGRYTQHSFSFGDHYDPERLGFGPMVCHDDHLLGPGRGFDTHRHSGLEIVTWVVSGALRHTDSSGSTTVLKAGSVGVLSTGDGVVHSEHATDDGPCRFVQVWLRPVEGESEPGYAARPVTLPAEGLVPVAQPRLDAVLWAGRLPDHGTLTLPEAHQLHVFVTTGALLRSSLAEPLSAGDAFEMTDEPPHTVTAGVPTDLLVWAFYDGPAPILLGPNGAYMTAGPSAGVPRDDVEEAPPVGQIQLMGDYGGAHLWDEEGGIDGDFDYLNRHLGISRALHDDLVRWGADWDGQANTPEHDARGKELLTRLQAECPAYEFVLRL